ncbi:MAG: hypothetical protein MSS51_00695 [Bacteroidales bacterium]|nr:hypothetical protein [Bacteroidales bacterium]
MEAKRIINPNGTYRYTLDGQVVRKGSKRKFKYMLVEVWNETARFVGLGNNRTTLMNSWKHLYEGCELKIIQLS